jgi:RNase adaptor protein for sRNA GlmZ degradation
MRRDQLLTTHMYIAVKTLDREVPNPSYSEQLKRLQPETVQEQVKDYVMLDEESEKIPALIAAGYVVYKISSRVSAKVVSTITYTEVPI